MSQITKGLVQETADAFLEAWVSGERRHVLEQLTGTSDSQFLTTGDIAAVTALMMLQLPTPLDQVRFQGELQDMVLSRD